MSEKKSVRLNKLAKEFNVDIVENKLLTVKVGLGFCLEVYSKPVASIGNR